MATLAEKHGALMVAVEHRFYGESQPTADMSTDNLRFLTSEQGLADLAKVTAYLKGFDPAAGPDTASAPRVLRSSPTVKASWCSMS